MQPLERLAQFRQQLYPTFTHRALALGEVIDAVAQVARPHSPAELSLVMQRHWSTLYDALDEGRIDLDALRPLLTRTAGSISPYRVAGSRVVIVDHSGYPRPAAHTVAERERYPGPNGTRQWGHRYSFLSQVVDPTGTWLAPLDVERSGPDSTPVGTALTHLARLAQTSAESLIMVGDREYGVNDLLRVVPKLPGVPVIGVARVRTNLVFYQAPPPCEPGKQGATRKYGARATQRPDQLACRGVAHQRTHGAGGKGRVVRLDGVAAAGYPGAGGANRAGVHPEGGWAAQVRAAAVADGGGRGVALGDGVAALSAAVVRRDAASPSQRSAGLEPGAGGHGGAARPLDLAGAAGVLAVAAGARPGARLSPPLGARAASGPLPLARVQRDYGRILAQFGLGIPPPKPRQPVLKRRLQAA